MKPSAIIPFSIALIAGIASFIFFLFELDAPQYIAAAVCLTAFLAAERKDTTESDT